MIHKVFLRYQKPVKCLLSEILYDEVESGRKAVEHVHYQLWLTEMQS